jgi:hypothetical protein
MPESKVIIEPTTLGGRSFYKLYHNGRIYWKEMHAPAAQWLVQTIQGSKESPSSTFFRVTDPTMQNTLSQLLEGGQKSS